MIQSLLAEEQLDELKQLIDPLEDCEDFGVGRGGFNGGGTWYNILILLINYS